MKKLAFEYVVFKLIEWFKTQNQIATDAAFNQANDLTKLKVIKLHFFSSAVNSKSNRLLDLFNNFYAMPYGHVESDIYNTINDLERYSISNNSLTIKPQYIEQLSASFNDFDASYKQEIDTAILNLSAENKTLIKYPALDLVELSHNYFSWKCMFNIARSQDRYSEPIPSQLIKEETKFFALNF
jgi:uncharacterized phage-associated protein